MSASPAGCRPLRWWVVAASLVTILAASGCVATVHLEPAADAGDPRCAEVTVGLRHAGDLGGQNRRWTDAQATAAWGRPGESASVILLRCGVAVPAPTSLLQCVTVEGVDWLVDPAEQPFVRVTTYGRDPAVQLYIDTDVVSSNDVLRDVRLVRAVSAVPAERHCTTRFRPA